MQNVTLICVGKLKEKYLRDACDEYSKRLSAFCKLNVIEINPHRLPDNPTTGEINSALEIESKAILSRISSSSKVFAMCIEGKQMSSEKLATTIDVLGIQGYNNLVFIIGGSHGLSDAVKNRADVRLSMSEMTFPHQLARVMLLEQIYRSYQIISGGKYHK